MSLAPQSRRDFLSASGRFVGASWLATSLPALGALAACARDAAREGRPFRVLSPEEGVELDALAAQIIPTDDTPGAREAGAVHFVDGLLETMPVEELENFRAGMAAFRERVRAVHPQAGGFAELSPADQIAFLELLDEEAKDAEAARAAAIEASAENAAVEGAAAAEEWAGDEPAPEHRFFDEARSVIVMGTFCHPNQGGNEDLIGWQILGLVPEPTYQSPFGYYDRGYVAEIPTEGV